METSGVNRSLTNAVTTDPNAAPMTTPTARSTTFPRSTNALKSVVTLMSTPAPANGGSSLPGSAGSLAPDADRPVSQASVAQRLLDVRPERARNGLSRALERARRRAAGDPLEREARILAQRRVVQQLRERGDVGV